MLFLNSVCNNSELKILLGFVKTVITIAQIIIPIALIVWGTLDLGKAVMASDEKKIKENQQTLIKRVATAIIVFLLATIVGFAMGIVGSDEWKTCWQGANTNCDLDPISGECKQPTTP